MRRAQKPQLAVPAGFGVKEAVLSGTAASLGGEIQQRELRGVTGTIQTLEGNARTGTIRSRDGSRFAFSAAGVLGEFDALAIGHLVNFDLDRAQPERTAVRVFREPLCARGSGKTLDASPDLRFTGFHQAESIRSYSFEAVAPGCQPRYFIVRVDMALLLKHHVGVQEVPALCLRKLAADLKTVEHSERHELDDDDLLAYALSRAAAAVRKRVKHSFSGRRGSPPPGPSGHVRAT